MSQQPPQKANFLQTFLIVTTIFLGYNLFFGGANKQTDTRSATQILQSMQKLNKDVKDITIVEELRKFESKINESEGDNKKSKTEIEQLKIHGVLLAAHTQYTAGMQRKETGRLQKAYDTLYSVRREFHNKPIWKEKFTVSSTKFFGSDNITPKELYGKISKDLHALNKTEKIFGFFPGYNFIDTLVSITGSNPAFSYGFAAVLLAFLVRIAIWPLAQKTFMHSRQMSQLMPLINELKEKYEGQKLNEKVMELHKEYGINPVSGCLPALAQIPLFLLIYQAMLHYRFEFKNGSFFWINQATSDATGGFIAPSLGEQDYILIVVYGISMIVTTLLTPVSDPVNGKQQRMTGMMIAAFFSVMMFFWHLPSAFILYWICTNVFATAQTLWSYRLPVPPLMKKSESGGSAPVSSMMDKSMFKSTGTPRKVKSKKKKS